jgi:hypothetical protein
VVLRDSLEGFTQEMKMFAAQKGIDEQQTRFNVARLEASQQFERMVKEGEQKKNWQRSLRRLNITSGPVNHRRGTTPVVEKVFYASWPSADLKCSGMLPQ